MYYNGIWGFFFHFYLIDDENRLLRWYHLRCDAFKMGYYRIPKNKILQHQQQQKKREDLSDAGGVWHWETCEMFIILINTRICWMEKTFLRSIAKVMSDGRKKIYLLLLIPNAGIVLFHFGREKLSFFSFALAHTYSYI